MDFQVFFVERPAKSRRCETLVIGFSDEDYAGVSLPHTDALVVTLAIANHKIHRILVDNGSSADILYQSPSKPMKIGQEKIVPAKYPFCGVLRRTSFTGRFYRTLSYCRNILELVNYNGEIPTSGQTLGLQRHYWKNNTK
jgi:hypothetical protein